MSAQIHFLSRVGRGRTDDDVWGGIPEGFRGSCIGEDLQVCRVVVGATRRRVDPRALSRRGVGWGMKQVWWRTQAGGHEQAIQGCGEWKLTSFLKWGDM